MLPKNRPPTSPGEMLLEEFLKPRGLTQVERVSRMGVSIQRVNALVDWMRGITAPGTLIAKPDASLGRQVRFLVRGDDRDLCLTRRATSQSPPPGTAAHR
jgi:plasmid maintenance system antidote protein VapI